MNQDFAMMATPANVRRLLRLQAICPIDLPTDIIALATQDQIGEADFDSMVCPYHPVKATIAQFLIDCRLRGIVQTAYHPEFDRFALLHTIKLSQPTKIIILSNRPSIWLPVIKGLRLNHITSAMVWYSLSNAEIEQYRQNTVLVIDVDLTTPQGKLKILSRVFPQTIVFEQSLIDPAQHTHWAIWARLLFPAMPHPLYTRMVKDTPQWCDRPLVNFAPFYNTCIFPDLITNPDTIEAMQDANQVKRLTSLPGLLISH